MKFLKEVLTEIKRTSSRHGGDMSGTGRADYQSRRDFKRAEHEAEWEMEKRVAANKGRKSTAPKKSKAELDKEWKELQKKLEADRKKSEAALKKKREKEIISVYGSMENYKKMTSKMIQNAKNSAARNNKK